MINTKFDNELDTNSTNDKHVDLFNIIETLTISDVVNIVYPL